jgi:hypothetical protein
MNKTRSMQSADSKYWYCIMEKIAMKCTTVFLEFMTSYPET